MLKKQYLSARVAIKLKIVQHNKEVYIMKIFSTNSKRKIKSLKHIFNEKIKWYLYYRSQFLIKFVLTLNKTR